MSTPTCGEGPILTMSRQHHHDYIPFPVSSGRLYMFPSLR